MARTVVGYEGKGRCRRAIYRDHGPARGRAGGADGDSIGRLGAQVLPNRFLTGGNATMGEMGGAGQIERRQATDAQRAEWAAERAETAPSVAPKYQLKPEQMARGSRPGPDSFQAASRARGAARAGFTPGATKPYLAARQSAPVTAPPPLEEGSVVASPAPVLKRDGVAVLAPCADCSHASVCSIRPTLAGKGLDADFSSSIPGVRVVAVSLECSFFLPNGATTAGTIGRYEAPHDDVVAALIALGYSTTEARRLAAAAPGATVEDRLRAALRGLVTEGPVEVARRLSPVDRLLEEPQVPAAAPRRMPTYMRRAVDALAATGGDRNAAAARLGQGRGSLDSLISKIRTLHGDDLTPAEQMLIASKRSAHG